MIMNPNASNKRVRRYALVMAGFKCERVLWVTIPINATHSEFTSTKVAPMVRELLFIAVLFNAVLINPSAVLYAKNGMMNKMPMYNAFLLGVFM